MLVAEPGRGKDENELRSHLPNTRSGVETEENQKT